MYSYVLNNPLINADPDGRECIWDDGTYDSNDDPETGSPEKCKGKGGTWVGHDVSRAVRTIEVIGAQFRMIA